MSFMVPDPSGGFVADTGLLQVVRRSATIPVTAELGRVEPVTLRLPWGMRVGGCFAFDEGAPRYIAIGQVMTPDSVLLSDALVRIAWADRDGRTTVETEVEARTTADGRFWLCGLPGDRALQATVVGVGGQIFSGVTSVPSVDYYENGEVRKSNTRLVTLVVDLLRRSGGSP
jgi:hypothetical protein